MEPNIQNLVREGSNLRVKWEELCKDIEKVKITLGASAPVNGARSLEDNSERMYDLK